MYGAVPPKSKVTARKPDDNTVEMQPLMVDPYFDKNFAPEVSFLSLQSILYILPRNEMSSSAFVNCFFYSQVRFHLSK